MIKLCVFDLDGTLANTLESMARPTNIALERMGFSPREVNKFKYFCGNGARVLIKRALADAGCTDEDVLDQAFKIYTSEFSKDSVYNIKLYDGVMELLNYLKSIGIKIAVLSNKPDYGTHNVINMFFGEDYFDFVAGQIEGIPKKPDPESALRIAKEFGAEPHECIFIGDTDVDMQTGSSAGMITVGVLWGYRDKEELLNNGAVHLVHRPLDIIDIIDEREEPLEFAEIKYE